LYNHEKTGMKKMIDNIKRPYFTPAFARRVRVALELNANELRDVYHHPSEKRIVEKCIDLSCRKPLHDAGGEHPKSSSSEEKWLEAYLIRKAKRNDWILELANKRFQFLYSQLNFRGSVTTNPRPLDLLLYELDTCSLVIFELKVKRRLKEAKEKELKYYMERVGEIKHEIADVFHLTKILGVQGYIVWPRNERANNDGHDFGLFGVIEYTRIAKPWDKFKESDEELTIYFSCVKESQIVR
jgi:hypothetical protein